MHSTYVTDNPCPRYYQYLDSYKNAGNEINTVTKTNINECATQCDGNSLCKTIGWNPWTGDCILFKVIKSDTATSGDYTFCAKGKYSITLSNLYHNHDVKC